MSEGTGYMDDPAAMETDEIKSALRKISQQFERLEHDRKALEAELIERSQE